MGGRGGPSLALHGLVLILFIFPCFAAAAWSVKVVGRVPHDADCFTQGLFFHEGFLYESCGLWGKSNIRKVNAASGRVVQQTHLADEHFAEGAERVGSEVVVLTWRSGVALRYNLDGAPFAVQSSHRYAGEGWGLCLLPSGVRHSNFAPVLVMSDGSDTLFFRHPDTFQLLGQQRVFLASGKPLNMINELECVDGWVFANAWYDHNIYAINPHAGTVNAAFAFNKFQLLDGRDPKAQTADVLNGIAYDSTQSVFYITGKLWPAIFKAEITIPYPPLSTVR